MIEKYSQARAFVDTKRAQRTVEFRFSSCGRFVDHSIMRYLVNIDNIEQSNILVVCVAISLAPSMIVASIL
jgi:hypothetical protein